MTNKNILAPDKHNYLFKAINRIESRPKKIIKQRTLFYKTPFKPNEIAFDNCYSLLFFYMIDYKVSDVDMEIFDRYSYVGDIINDNEFLIEYDILIEKDINEYRIFKVLTKETGELYLNKIFNTSDLQLFIEYCLFLNQTEYKNNN